MSASEPDAVRSAAGPAGPATSAAQAPAVPAWVLPCIVALGVLLRLPSLGMGFYADDHMHQLAMEGHLPLRPWALFDFGATADWAQVGERSGGLPWWTSADWSIRFFRPLSSLSLVLDHALFGRNPVGYHAMSLALLAALLVAVHATLRRIGMSPRAAVAGTAFYAASQATALPTAWIANRNSLLAALFTTLAVASIASHARLGRARALGFAFAAATLACLSKESGVVAFAAVAAYLVIARDGLASGWARRAAMASVACALVFVVFLAAAGYGTKSAFYATPWADPGRFAANLGILATVGSLALATPAPPDLVFLAPQTTVPLVVASVVAVVPLGIWMFRRLRGDRVAAFLVVWTILSMGPEAGAPTSDRLLVTASIGGAGLLALLVTRVLAADSGARRAERVLAWTVVVFAGVLEALATAGQCAALAASADALRTKVLAADVGAPALGPRSALVLQSDDPIVPFSIAVTWAFHTRDLDVRFDTLQTGRRSLRWTREDDRTMVFETLDRPFASDPFEVVYRTTAAPIAVGTVFRGTAFDVEVLAAPDAAGAVGNAVAGAAAEADGVRRIRVRWHESPAGPRFRFLVPRDGRLVAVEPPAPGASIVLPEAPAASPFAR